MFAMVTFHMNGLEQIDGWEDRDSKPGDDVTEDGEIWTKIDESSGEVIIDRAGPDEPRSWKVILPDGCRRFSRSRPVVVALAGLYMRTGLL
jgi:hypothetical protein